MLFKWIRVDTPCSLAELTKFWIGALIYKIGFVSSIKKIEDSFYRMVVRTDLEMENA